MSSAGPNRYDAFLSYNSQDRPAVEELAKRLRKRGLGLYLEVWELLPGREFQPGLAEALIDSKTCVVVPRAERPGAVAEGGDPGRHRQAGTRCRTSTSSRSCSPAPSGRGVGPSRTWSS